MGLGHATVLHCPAGCCTREAIKNAVLAPSNRTPNFRYENFGLDFTTNLIGVGSGVKRPQNWALPFAADCPAQVPANLRYASDSDHSRYYSELILSNAL